MNESTKTPAFLVVCGAFDSAADPEYERLSLPPARRAGLAPIAGGGLNKIRVLEGALPAGTEFIVIERFPSMEALEQFYFSKDYQAAIAFRGGVRIEFMLAVDGITEADQAAMMGEAPKQA